MKRSELIFSALLVPTDFLMLFAAGLTAYFLRTGSLISGFLPVRFNLPLREYLLILSLIIPLWLIIFALAGLYKLKITRSTIEEFFGLVTASAAGFMAVVVFIFLRGEFFDSRFIILVAWFFAVVFVMAGRIIMRQVQKYLLVHYDFGSHKVLVIGKDDLSRLIVEQIETEPASGYKIVKHLFQPDIAEVRQAGDNPGIDEVILADPDYPKEKVLELIDFCNETRLTFKYVPNLFQALTTNVGVDTFTGLPLIELKRTALEGWGKIIKKIIDVIGSLFGIIFFAPLMALIALAVKLDSPGPVTYRNQRVGQKGVFDTYKFRSMKFEYCTGPYYPNAGKADTYEERLRDEKSKPGPVFKILNDPRRTKIGRFLEKTSLDELPQFFNVLKGEMSLVGPRPHMPKEVAQYERRHQVVFNVKPGITGLAQISGRSDLDFEEEVKLDAYYIENWSLALDFKIMLKTPFAVLFKKHKQ